MGSKRLALRLAAMILVVCVLGLPIDDLASYGLAVAAALAIFTGSMATRPLRWIAAAVLAAAVVAGHLLWPSPRIEEGDNAFVPGPRVAETSGLPADVLAVMSAQFDAEYPPEKRCDEPRRGCWRPDRTAAEDGFAFAADGVYRRPAYSAASPASAFPILPSCGSASSTTTSTAGRTTSATSIDSCATATRSICSIAIASSSRCS